MPPGAAIEDLGGAMQLALGTMTGRFARAILRRGFAGKSTLEWAEFMYSQPNIMMARVRGHEDVITDEQNLANEYIVPMTMPVIGESKVIGNLVRLSKTPGSVKGPAPEPGDHTAEIMTELRFNEKDIKCVIEQTARLREEIVNAGEES